MSVCDACGKTVGVKRVTIEAHAMDRDEKPVYANRILSTDSEMCIGCREALKAGIESALGVKAVKA